MNLVTYKEGAMICGVTPSTFSSYVGKGHLPKAVCGTRGSSTNQQKWNGDEVKEYFNVYKRMLIEKKARAKRIKESTGSVNYRLEKHNTAPQGYILANKLLSKLIK